MNKNGFRTLTFIHQYKLDSMLLKLFKKAPAHHKKG